MPTPLPPFEPVPTDELRRLWTAHRDPDIRRLILEVERYRRIVAEVDGLHGSIQQAWHDQVGGQLVALFRLKTLLHSERFRLPRIESAQTTQQTQTPHTPQDQ